MRLRDWMSLNGMTRREVASLLGVSINTVDRWNNHTRVPKPWHMRAIAELTGNEVDRNSFADGFNERRAREKGARQ